MIFSSINPSTGLPKWQYLLSLKVGARFTTRREIKPEEPCCDGYPLSASGHKKGFCVDGSEGCKFFPKRFAIGKTFCVQVKRTGGALCGCGFDTKGWHYVDYEKEPNGHAAKPARFKIVGGMWHKDWVKEASKKYCWGSQDFINAELAEAKLEGFGAVKPWIDWYPAHKIDIQKTWRILAERVI